LAAGLVLGLLPAAWGQPVPSRSRSSLRAPVTFNNQIVRIFQQNCQACHHPGDVGPFSMMSHREVVPWLKQIKTEVQARRMPPWKPVPGHGEFVEERRLSQQEIELIARWVDSGAPEGDPRDLPAPLEFSEQWTLGTPDLVLEPEADFVVPAEGSDVYRCFSIPTRLLQGRHVTSIEMRPGNRSVVHHVLLFPDPLGVSATMAKPNDPQAGYSCFGGPGIPTDSILGAWAPGIRPQVLPPGVGVRLTPGGRVVMQVHYHVNGTPQGDRTRVGLYFARDPAPKELLWAPIANLGFEIPPGESRYTVTASFSVPPFLNARAHFIGPHMHQLGREMRAEAVFRDGTRRPLIYIDDWDFNWQAIYTFREPVLLPSGTRIEVTAVYDNSTGNPRNPFNPPRPIRWGEQTTDEMCLLFIGVTLE